MKYTNIRVLVSYSNEYRYEGAIDVRECDTVKEAKEFAKYALTVDYQRSGELSSPANVATIRCVEDGQDIVLNEYWRKGWTPPQDADDTAN